MVAFRRGLGAASFAVAVWSNAATAVAAGARNNHGVVEILRIGLKSAELDRTGQADGGLELLIGLVGIALWSFA
jgi:hypothetical protein